MVAQQSYTLLILINWTLWTIRRYHFTIKLWKQTGTHYITGKGWWAHQQNSFTDWHYTTLIYSAAMGGLVIWSVIIDADKLKDHNTLGCNCCSPDWKDGMEDWRIGMMMRLVKFWQKRTCASWAKFSCVDLHVSSMGKPYLALLGGRHQDQL